MLLKYFILWLKKEYDKYKNVPLFHLRFSIFSNPSQILQKMFYFITHYKNVQLISNWRIFSILLFLGSGVQYIHGFVAMTVSRLKSFLLSRHINKSNTWWSCLDANHIAKINKLINYSVLCVMPYRTSIW
jgi:hypothetical protein